MDARFADDGRVLDLGRQVGRRQDLARIGREVGLQPFRRQFVAVAVDAGKGDLAGDPDLPGRERGSDGAGLRVGRWSRPTG